MGVRDIDVIRERLSRMIGEECWYVAAGGCVGSIFSMSCGGRIVRPYPILNRPDISEEYRKYMGEVYLLVWCDWRLDGPKTPVASSDEEADVIAESLEKELVGQKVLEVEVFEPAWDLKLRLTNDLCMNVFCNHIPGDPSYSGNWQFHLSDSILVAGPGYKWEIEQRE